MTSDNWIVQNIINALETWNDKLTEIWTLLTTSPETFRGGGIWTTITTIHGALQAIGIALLVLFFVIGAAKTCSNLTDVKRPEHALRLFIRFAIAKGLVTYGLELMMAIFKIAQGMINTVMTSSGFAGNSGTMIPQEIVTAIEDCNFLDSIALWAVTFIGCLVITVLSFMMILTIYGRFFKLYMYTAVSPIPLASFAGEPTSFVGKSFLKSYAGVCAEGLIIILACVIYSAFVTTPPVPGGATVSMVWTYIGEVIFNMLILVGCIKGADKMVHEMCAL